jgi:formyltetrahydrofolate hydrolase
MTSSQAETPRAVLLLSCPDARGIVAEWFGIPFYHFPVTKETRAEVEHRVLAYRNKTVVFE